METDLISSCKDYVLPWFLQRSHRDGIGIENAFSQGQMSA